MEAGIPPERVQQMRAAIHEHLQSSNVYSEVRAILNAHAADHVDFNPNNPTDVLDVLRERGLISQVLASVKGRDAARQVSMPVRESAAASVARSLRANQRLLHVRLLGGRAFLEHFDETPEMRREEHLVVSAHFGSQRFRSGPQPCSCDPAFDDDFVVHFEPSLADLVDCSAPLHLCVTLEHHHGLRARVVGENAVDWRKVLQTGVLNLSVELAGPTPGVPAGILELQLEMLPHTRPFTESQISAAADRERSMATAADREFLLYARRWWSEFHAVRPSHATRKVKVFAQAAGGRMLPVTHYVTVMQPDRVIDAPEDAARFVSLLAVEAPAEDPLTEVVQGERGTKGEQWLPAFLFLAQRRGDAPNHAALLCSLLLGFGLDAYCACGTRRDGQQAIFVITRRRVEATTYAATVWDPTTGQRYDQSGAHPFAAVGSVFNSSILYANVAEDDRVVAARFDLDDETAWMPMNPAKLRLVPAPPPPPLLWIPQSERALECTFEEQLRAAVSAHRENLSMPTRWDDTLPHVFGQALAKYEAQRRGTVTAPDLALFHAGIKGRLGLGRTFKAAPLNVAHTDAPKTLQMLLGLETGKEVAECDQDETYLALRVKAYVFPEGVVSLWVMLAARYRSVLA